MKFPEKSPNAALSGFTHSHALDGLAGRQIDALFIQQEGGPGQGAAHRRRIQLGIKPSMAVPACATFRQPPTEKKRAARRQDRKKFFHAGQRKMTSDASAQFHKGHW